MAVALLAMCFFVCCLIAREKKGKPVFSHLNAAAVSVADKK